LDYSKRFIKIAAIIFAVFISKSASAAEMADTMRSDGKIWVVVTVIAIILIGLFIYLFTIDRKITSVEKQLNQDKKQ
jgi:heme/copper-type cytochrome/quinol oxidase subunit 2